MPDVAGRDHEDHVLGDVGGVVADAFEVAGDEDQVQRRLDLVRILEHVGEQFPEDLRLQRVQRVVGVQDLLGQQGVPPDEGVQGVAEHPWAMSAMRGMSISSLTGAWPR